MTSSTLPGTLNLCRMLHTWVVLVLISATIHQCHTLCLDGMSRDPKPQLQACLSEIAGDQVEAGWGLHSQSLRFFCGYNMQTSECRTLSTNTTYCLERFRAEALENMACKHELQSFERWLTHREALAVQAHIACNADMLAEKTDGAEDCMRMIRHLELPMAEDWAFEEDLRASCRSAVDAACGHVLSGQGRLNTCLRQNSPNDCTVSDIGGMSLGNSFTNKMQGMCKVAVVSTYPPKNCGLATFTAALLARLRVHPRIMSGCEIGVIALSDPSDRLAYKDPIVHYDMRMDSALPSGAMLEMVHFIHKVGYSHVIIQQEFGLTPIMWQIVDLARWLDPRIQVLTVVHSPRARPNLEERGVVRAMSEMSDRLIVMSWYGRHSLIAAYGIEPDKIVFIPHGVDIPESRGQARRLTSLDRSRYIKSTSPQILSEIVYKLTEAGVDENSQLILSNGLVHQGKRLDRVINAFSQVLQKHPSTFFLVLGREHPTEPLAGQLMKNLMEQAAAQKVRDHVIWLDKFVATEELLTIFQCTSVFLTPFDEITPTSGTLLMAMANRMSIISTPYHFALEMLQDSRGIIVPYIDVNGTHLAKAMCDVLQDPAFRDEMGARAQALVKSWSWRKVADQYATLILGELPVPLSPDPFANAPGVIASANWNGSSIVLPNSKTWDSVFFTPPPRLSMGAYALYVDVDIQVNGAINPEGDLFGIGIISRYFWVLMNLHVGIDFEWNPQTVTSGQLGDWGLEIDLMSLSVNVQSQNAAMRIQLDPSGVIALQIDILNRFAAPEGILGQHYHNTLDVSQERQPFKVDTWQQWQLPNNVILSTKSRGQTWAVQFSDAIQSNVMWLSDNSQPRHRFRTRNDDEAILFLFEGAIYGPSGIAQVNRRYWLQLMRPFEPTLGRRKFNVLLDPQEPSKTSSLMKLGVLETLIYDAHLTQSWEKSAQIGGPGILFRNAWPPNFAKPKPGFVYIHHQAFEFQGIPSSWVHPLNNITQDVWVPSEYNADAFEASGIHRDKIFVLKHGIEFGKFNVSVPGYSISTQKAFKFLFNGGLLPRKGIDVLLSAYTAAFKATDNVTLILHSVYGDEFQLEEIYFIQRNATMPEIIFLQDELSHFQMVKLYKAADVYVSPYRSEGFGLTVLEAMAMGLQVIITDFGPITEICPTNVAACFPIEAEPSQCMLAPCGKMTLFGEHTVQQPSWSEPRESSLIRRMQEVFQNWQAGKQGSGDLRGQIMAHAKQMSWYDVGSVMINRLLSHLSEGEPGDVSRSATS